MADNPGMEAYGFQTVSKAGLSSVMPDTVMPGLTRHLIKPGIAGQARNDG